MANSKWIRPLSIGLGLVALVFLSYHLGRLEVLELKSLDLRFQFRGPLPSQVPLVLVSIDQDSFDEVGFAWPWPRTLHAELIRKLAASGALLIAFDIVFADSQPEEDQELADAIQTAGNVILAAEYTHVESDFGPKMSIILDPLIREHALGYGLANMDPDRDGIVRRAPLATRFQERTYWALAYRIYRAFAGRDNLPSEGVALTPMLINFRGPARSYRPIPYYRILADEIDPAVFRDKIVLVGAFAPILHDLFPTPFSASEQTAGVEIQANFVETLAANDPIIPVKGWTHGALFFLLTTLTIWAAIRYKPLRAFAVIFGLGLAYALATFYLFVHDQLWVPFVPPLLAIALSYGGITLDNYIREYKERMRVRSMFSKYVSPDVMEEILENREGLALGGRRRHITVLFSDVRGFTSISEQIGPEQVVAFLSDYLPRAAQLVFKHGGTVDKFIGDAVMAIFGAPKSYGDDALRAVKAGLEMIELIDSMTQKWSPIIGRPFKVGVGINSGDAVVGSIGSDIRSDFTAIGDTVNLAARLEGLTKELGVSMLISETTAEEAGNAVPLKALRRIKVIGRETPLLVHTPASLVDESTEVSMDLDEPYVQQHK